MHDKDRWNKSWDKAYAWEWEGDGPTLASISTNHQTQVYGSHHIML